MSDADGYQANMGSSELMQKTRQYQAFMNKMEILKDVKKDADEKIVQVTKLDGDLQEVKMQYVFLKKGQNMTKRGLGVLTVAFVLNLLFGGREGTIFIDKLTPVINSQLANTTLPDIASWDFSWLESLLKPKVTKNDQPTGEKVIVKPTPKVDVIEPKVDPPKPIELVVVPPPVVECKMGQIQIDQYKSMNEDLLFNLEVLTNQVKNASKNFFKFDVVNDSLLEINQDDSEPERMVQRYLEVIYWLHFHSQSGSKKGLRPRPQNDKLTFGKFKLKQADWIPRFAKEMTEVLIDDQDDSCKITMPNLSEENYLRLHKRLELIKDTYIGFGHLVSNKESL